MYRAPRGGYQGTLGCLVLLPLGPLEAGHVGPTYYPGVGIEEAPGGLGP